MVGQYVMLHEKGCVDRKRKLYFLSTTPIVNTGPSSRAEYIYQTSYRRLYAIKLIILYGRNEEESSRRNLCPSF
jgi:hypothetical protein